MCASDYVGRVGVLAAALGIGAAVTFGGGPLAWASPDDSSATTGLLQEQVTSEMACPPGWAGRMLLCPGLTPESSVMMLSGSPETVRTG